MFRRIRRPPQLRVQPLEQKIIAAARSSSSQASRASRIDRLTAKLPRRLQKYTNGLRNAPLSHVVAFLILHEITAVVPLVALFALFHYTTCMPIAYMTEHSGESIQRGIARFERYFRRKGWFGFDPEEVSTGLEGGAESQDQAHTEHVMEQWRRGEPKYRILVEVALAYAATKALLPIRIIGSAWATPWFASVLMRARRLLTRKS